jgi:ankyrin repeat protein
MITFFSPKEKMQVEPNHFKCPITGQIFCIPVLGEDGILYEEEAISRWLKRSTVSPVTKKTLKKTTYCYFAKNMVDLFLEKNPEHREDRYRPNIFSYVKRDIDVAVLEEFPKSDLSKIDKNGYTPLAVAITKKKSAAAIRLIELGEFLPEQTFGGRSLLGLACGNKLTDVAMELIRHQWFVPGFQDPHGSTALGLVCEHGPEDLALALIEADPISVGLMDGDGDTPLIMACASGFGRAAQKLLESGGRCQPARVNNQQQTALNEACRHGLKEVAMELYERGFGTYHQAVAWSSYANLTYQNTLNLACQRDMPELVKKMLEGGLAYQGQQDIQGDTPLIWACRRGWNGIALKLIETGFCHPVAINREGECALLIACRRELYEIVPSLLDACLGYFDHAANKMVNEYVNSMPPPLKKELETVKDRLAKLFEKSLTFPNYLSDGSTDRQSSSSEATTNSDLED